MFYIYIHLNTKITQTEHASTVETMQTNSTPKMPTSKHMHKHSKCTNSKTVSHVPAIYCDVYAYLHTTYVHISIIGSRRTSRCNFAGAANSMHLHMSLKHTHNNMEYGNFARCECLTWRLENKVV